MKNRWSPINKIKILSYPKNIQNVKNINLIIFYSNNILQYEKGILWKRNITHRKKNK